MDNSKRLLKPYIILLALALAVTVTLRSLACLVGLDYKSGYFTNGSLHDAAVITLVIFCFMLFSYIFFATKTELRADFTTPHTYVPAGVCAAALLFFGVELLSKVKYSAFFDDLENLIKDSASFGKYQPETTIYDVLVFICGVLALLAIVHFFLNADLTENHSVKRASYSLTTVMLLALYAAVLYFDGTLPINAPNKLTDQMAFLFASVFFLYESRISLGREKWRGYVTFGLIGTLLGAYSSIPALLTYFIKGEVISASVSENALLFAISLFIFLRLILVARLAPVKENSLATALRAMAKAREQEISPIIEEMENEAARDEAQLSIDDIIPKEEDGDTPDAIEGENTEIPEVDDSESITPTEEGIDTPNAIEIPQEVTEDISQNAPDTHEQADLDSEEITKIEETENNEEDTGN